MIDPIIVGRRLKAVREILDWKQYEFAEAAELSRTAYNNWERGRQLVPPESALKLCERFGMTMDFIYGGKLDALPTNISKELSSKLRDNAQSTSNEMPEAAEAPSNFSKR